MRKSEHINFCPRKSKYSYAGSNKQCFTIVGREGQVNQNISSFARESKDISELRRTKWNIFCCVEKVEQFILFGQKSCWVEKVKKFCPQNKTSQNSVEKKQNFGRESRDIPLFGQKI